MRKFTREIAALLTSVAVSSGASAGTAFAEEIEPVKTAGVAINTDLIDEPGTTTTTTTTTIPPLSGTMTGTTTTTTVTVPPLEGTMTGTTTATTTLPPLSGTMTGTTTTVTSTIPPLAGTMTGIITTVTTTIPPLAGTMTGTTTAVTTTMPPFAGGVWSVDGDVNNDGSFGISDVVSFQKYLLNSQEGKNGNWNAADLNYDGELDVFDLIAMKRELIRKNQYLFSPLITSGDIIELSKKGKDITWDDLKDFRCIGGIGTGGFVYRYQLGDMNDKFCLFVTVDNDVIKSAALECVGNSDRIDIREGDVEAFIAKNNPPA